MPSNRSFAEMDNKDSPWLHNQSLSSHNLRCLHYQRLIGEGGKAWLFSELTACKSSLTRPTASFLSLLIFGLCVAHHFTPFGFFRLAGICVRRAGWLAREFWRSNIRLELHP